MRLKAPGVVSILFALAAGLTSASFSQSGETNLAALPKQFAATAFGQAGRAAGRSFGLTIYITGWSSNEQVRDFVATLKQQGQQGLISSMEKTESVGRLAPTGSVGIDLRLTRHWATKDGGMHVIMATNRILSWPELYNISRSTDYPFTVLSLDLDKNGKGSGKLTPLCKVKFNKNNQLEVENFGQKPFALTNVYVQK